MKCSDSHHSDTLRRICVYKLSGDMLRDRKECQKVIWEKIHVAQKWGLTYNHWQNCWNDGWFRGAPLPHYNVVRWKGKTWPTLEQNFAAAILNVKSTLNGGKGGCWIFFINLNEKQGVVRCAFQLLLSLIVLAVLHRHRSEKFSTSKLHLVGPKQELFVHLKTAQYGSFSWREPR